MISHYTILAPLGAGGMGEVLLAEDQRLERKVAVKVLRSDRIGSEGRRRLLREARAVARLDHPNVCGIYEVGEDNGLPFIVMPLLEGETLASRLSRGPLQAREALAIAIQIAEALKALHGAEVLHRDIKPSNVMVGPSGRVRVMDFGIAKIVDQEAPARESTSDATQTRNTLTLPATRIGTTLYMSPEQARGEPIDGRSDIFSLGVLLFEMLSGRRPFEGRSEAETVSAILTAAPPLSQLPGDAPAGLTQLVSKALQKDREERYQTASDLAVDLRSLEREMVGAQTTSFPLSRHGRRMMMLRWAVPLALAALLVAVALGFGLRRVAALRGAPQIDHPISSLAVLPLENLSGDATQDYFSDGMTEALITELARISALKVISRTSIMQYKNARKPLPQIARELGVEGIVEGSVARDRNRVRITAKLIHAASDRNLWAESYEWDLVDVLSLQRQVARAITDQVRVTLTPEETRALLAHRAVAVEVQDAYLRGLHLFNTGLATVDTTGSPELLERSVAAFEETTRLDPSWAEAWAALARSRHWVASFGSPAFYLSAKAAALRAIELDDSNADAHGALAFVLQRYEWAWADAEREFTRAIQLNPSIGNGGHHGYAIMLSTLGRHQEAMAMFAKAEALDPLVLTLRANAASAAVRARRFDEALERGRRALEINPKASWAYMVAGRVRLAQGQASEALTMFRQYLDLSPGGAATSAVGCGLALTGRRQDAIRLAVSLARQAEAAEVPPIGWLQLARLYACLADTPRTMAALERAFAVRLDTLPLINVDWEFEPLRSDPRFQALLTKMNLPPLPAQ